MALVPWLYFLQCSKLIFKLVRFAGDTLTVWLIGMTVKNLQFLAPKTLKQCFWMFYNKSSIKLKAHSVNSYLGRPDSFDIQLF